MDNNTGIEIYSNFEIHTKEVSTPNGISVHKDLVFKRELDSDIIKILTELLDNDEVYNNPVTICATELYPHLKTIQSKIEDGGLFNLIELSYWLNEHFKDKIEQLERMEADGKVNYSNLEQIFKIGTKCIGYINEFPVGFIVARTDRTIDAFGVPVFNITGKITISRGDKFVQYDKSFNINAFGGAVLVKNLSVRPISKDELLILTERGRKFVKYALSSNFVEYTGYMFKRTMYGLYKFKADGRVMIDPTGFNKKNPGYQSNRTFIECESVPEDLMFMCYPFTTGFSFATKEWGEIIIDNISEIKFDDNAFDYLVLDESIKRMVKALVVNSEGTFQDIIQKKSGGTIICLHGSPGTGKTVCTESICELLHKPLYSIGAGELSSTVEILEKKLAEILEIAYAWNAVILIDEADIFMEKRSTNDIQRNAMVSVFLRLLERFQGIMFLTTNRPDEFDDAVHSRISISIRYKDLDYDARFKVWTNLLNASGTKLSEADIKKLSGHHMNGRQIKNCIRMSQCLAKDQKQNVCREIIEEVIPFII